MHENVIEIGYFPQYIKDIWDWLSFFSETLVVIIMSSGLDKD